MQEKGCLICEVGCVEAIDRGFRFDTRHWLGRHRWLGKSSQESFLADALACLIMYIRAARPKVQANHVAEVRNLSGTSKLYKILLFKFGWTRVLRYIRGQRWFKFRPKLHSNRTKGLIDKLRKRQARMSPISIAALRYILVGNIRLCNDCRSKYLKSYQICLDI